MDVMALQDQFGGGIFRGRRAPADSVYDAVNALVNDERLLFRRGGSAYKSNANAGATLVGLWDGHVSAGPRTVFWTTSDLLVLDTNDASPLTIRSPQTIPPYARAAAVGGAMAFPVTLAGLTGALLYAGSRKTSVVTAGVATVTNGSAVVTGASTSWAAGGVDAGMIFATAAGGGVVKSVESNTSLTLTAPWPKASASSVAYALEQARRVTPEGLSAYGVSGASEVFVAAVGTVPRLLMCARQRVFFSNPGDPFTFTDGDYHELPEATHITGATAIEGTAVILTTSGVWAISNLDFDPLDDVGNVQHQVQQISQDVILWGDPGVAAYQGALVVPAIDDVYAVSLGAPPVSISDGIRPLYREYVEAGYKPGTATVYRGHYFLPVLDSSNAVIDLLVCRLDLRDPRGGRRPAWTRWANHAAGGAYAGRVGATTRTPKLLGINGQRVTDLTGCFDPDATRKDDADGTDHQFTVISNDFDTGPGLYPNTVQRAIVDYELVDAAADNPTVSMATATGAEGSSFTTCTAMATGAATGPESDGTAPVAFQVIGPAGEGARKVERIRWRFQTTGAAVSTVLRRVQVFGRFSGSARSS